MFLVSSPFAQGLLLLLLLLLPALPLVLPHIIPALGPPAVSVISASPWRLIFDAKHFPRPQALQISLELAQSLLVFRPQDSTRLESLQFADLLLQPLRVAPRELLIARGLLLFAGLGNLFGLVHFPLRSDWIHVLGYRINVWLSGFTESTP